MPRTIGASGTAVTPQRIIDPAPAVRPRRDRLRAQVSVRNDFNRPRGTLPEEPWEKAFGTLSLTRTIRLSGSRRDARRRPCNGPQTFALSLASPCLAHAG